MKNHAREGVPLSRSSSYLPMLLMMGVFAVAFPGAANAVGEAMPYEAGIDVLVTSLQGPVPFIISLVGIVACGAMLIFGGEISGFMRTMVFIVLVVSVIVQASTLISILGLEWKPGAAQTRSAGLRHSAGRSG